MNYHIGRLVLSSLCVGAFVVADIWWCLFCRLQPAKQTPTKRRTKTVLGAQQLKNFSSDLQNY
jgi:hypothetical protein